MLKFWNFLHPLSHLLGLSMKHEDLKPFALSFPGQLQPAPLHPELSLGRGLGIGFSRLPLPVSRSLRWALVTPALSITVETTPLKVGQFRSFPDGPPRMLAHKSLHRLFESGKVQVPFLLQLDKRQILIFYILNGTNPPRPRLTFLSLNLIIFLGRQPARLIQFDNVRNYQKKPRIKIFFEFPVKPLIRRTKGINPLKNKFSFQNFYSNNNNIHHQQQQQQ